MRAVVFSSNKLVNACIQCVHSHPQLRLNAAARLGPIVLKNCQLTTSDPKARVTIVRFRKIRARFNKRATPAFPKADHRSDICNAPLANSNIDKSVSLLAGGPPCLTEKYDEDAFTLDDCSRPRLRRRFCLLMGGLRNE